MPRLKFFGLEWTREHKSKCGRFECRKIGGADDRAAYTWVLLDYGFPRKIDGPSKSYHVSLKEAKARADFVSSK